VATTVLKDAFFSLNGTDQSDNVTQLEFSADLDAVEDTAMGDDSRSYLPGLRNGTISVTWNQDFSSGDLDSDLWTIYIGDAAVAFEARPSSAGVGVDNPKFTGSCLLTSFSPISGSVGELATSPTTLQITGDVTRATS